MDDNSTEVMSSGHEPGHNEDDWKDLHVSEEEDAMGELEVMFSKAQISEAADSATKSAAAFAKASSKRNVLEEVASSSKMSSLRARLDAHVAARAAAKAQASTYATPEKKAQLARMLASAKAGAAPSTYATPEKMAQLASMLASAKAENKAEAKAPLVPMTSSAPLRNVARPNIYLGHSYVM